ncbi:MAG TPA: GNAT family N-acetyltransferase [Anaerolineales bacterium]|nr:GNAT family N-acetyltransferase [Anaerolineales bacterium]
MEFNHENHPLIRPYRASDFDSLTILWRISREKSLPDFQRAKGHFFYEDQEYFQGYVLPRDKVWVAVLDKVRVAFLAMNESYIDQLYVHPNYWRRGIGESLLNYAKGLSPQHLWLYTLQINFTARVFYEKNGFVAEKFGVSPAPESEPDVEYHWRPQNTNVVK